MSSQLKVIIAGFAVIFLMGLFPPWVRITFQSFHHGDGYYHQNTSYDDVGREFLFEERMPDTHINVALLLKQWVVVSGITLVIVLWITRAQRKHGNRQRRFEREHHMHQAWDEIDGGGH